MASFDDGFLWKTASYKDIATFIGNEDAWVENGRVELLSITRAGSVIFDSETHVGDPAAFGIDENGGSVFLKKGDYVTMRLIPDYGYQLASVNINGVDELLGLLVQTLPRIYP